MNQWVAQTLHEKNTVPLVSVVLPVYNGEKYLAEAIDSILMQTFKDFELIMIDDGSTDSSQSILREYEARDARIRVLLHENQGLATTLNNSIDIARGTWVARMDQDDISELCRFDRQLKWLEKTGADIAGSWVQRFGTLDKRVIKLSQTDEAIKMAMLFSSPFAHPSVMMRTELVSKLRYDSAFEKAEDYDLWVRAAESEWKMTNVPEVLLFYRVHSSQISTKSASQQQQLTQKIRQRYWNFIFNNNQLDKKLVSECLKIFELPLPSVNMDAVDTLLTLLLRSAHGEAKDVIFNHLTRLYYKVAACHPNIASRWGGLNREFSERRGSFTKVKLWLFWRLRIRSDGCLFNLLKKIYAWKVFSWVS